MRVLFKVIELKHPIHTESGTVDLEVVTPAGERPSMEAAVPVGHIEIFVTYPADFARFAPGRIIAVEFVL